MLLELAPEIGNVGLSLLLAVAHLGVEGLARRGHEASAELVLLAGHLLDLAQPSAQGGHFVGLEREPALLGGAQLVLDVDARLGWRGLGRGGALSRRRRLGQDHLVAQTALRLLLAADLRRYGSNERIR